MDSVTDSLIGDYSNHKTELEIANKTEPVIIVVAFEFESNSLIAEPTDIAFPEAIDGIVE